MHPRSPRPPASAAASAAEDGIEVTLASLAAGGEAVGRLPQGQVIFVPGGAPGDRVVVRITEEKKGFVRGRIVRLLEAGAARVTPPCPLAAGRCGGCPWMHVDPAAQRAAKEDLVRRALRHSEAEIRPILAPVPDLGYRLRARLYAQGGRLGFQAARSHEVTPVPECPVMVPALARTLLPAAAQLGPLIGAGGTLAGVVGADGAVHLAVRSGRGAERARIDAVIEALLAAPATLAGAVIDGHRLGQGTVALGDDGAGALLASAESFAQASAAGHDLLPALVAAAALAPQVPPAAAPQRVLELYAGSGNLTRALLLGGADVLAIEGEPLAAARLAQLRPQDPSPPADATTAPPRGSLRVQTAAVEDALHALCRAGATFDAVVLDPPRAGAAAAVPALVRLGARRVVYVSCDPMTLSRDVQALRAAGYVARWAQPIDLMPHTAHVETVVLLER